MEHQASQYVFHLSGFGQFNGVDRNPTEILMSKITEYLKNHPWHHHVEIASITRYEVSAVGALQAFNDVVLSRTLSLFDSSNSKRHVFLLFGVNSKAEAEFALEKIAWNDASFRVPDERGWQPDQQPIIPQNGTIQQNYVCKLPLERIKDRLRSESFSVKISEDPGRFLCNYLYYHSMNLAAQHGLERMSSVFIHVPPFEKIAEESQLAFIRSLIDSIVVEYERTC